MQKPYIVKYIVERLRERTEKASLFFYAHPIKGVGNKQKVIIMQKRNRKRPDLEGNQQGIYKRNRSILRKTATVCALCGLPLDNTLKHPDPMSTSVDHIIPVALGGRSSLDNLQATHLICNMRKGKKIIQNQDNRQRRKEIEKSNFKYSNTIPQYIDWSNYQVQE